MPPPKDPKHRPGNSASRQTAASRKVPWTGALDQTIGRARHLRGKLFFIAFTYSVIVFLTLFFVLSRGFGTAFSHLTAGTDSWSLILVFLLLYGTAIAALAVLDFFLIRPLRALENINPQASLGVMIAGFFDRHTALENRFAQLAVEVKGLAGEREDLAAHISQLALQESTASATLKGILMMSKDLLVVTEADGRVKELTPPLQEILGLGPDEAVGRPFEQVIRLFDLEEQNPLDHPMPDFVHDAVAQHATTPNLERAILMDAKGRQHPVLASAAAVAGSGGTVVSGIVLMERFETNERVPVSETVVQVARPVSRDRVRDADAFAQRAAELVEQAHSRNAKHVMLLLSADAFESVNNRYGHSAGDSLLWEIGQILISEVPALGECFQISGTYFAVLLPNASTDVGAAVAERIRVAVDGREFKWQDMRYDTTVSIGAVPFGSDCEGYKALLEYADQSLIAAKASGANRVYVLAPDRAVKMRRHDDQEWVQWLSLQSQHGRLHMISQEIQPLHKDLQPMLEMLVRVEDEDGVWVEPGAFLPSLVRRNLTAKLDLQLIKRVVMALEHDPATVKGYVTLCVNLSGTSITDPNFAVLVERLLSSTKLPAGRIGFEVDALVAINHPADFARFIQTVKPTGARFSLDRCKAALGLNALATQPIDFVKIHPSLVEKATRDTLDRSYVEWINKSVHLLGRKTVATGVASAATLAFLKDVGVDYVQGTQINKLGPLII